MHKRQLKYFSKKEINMGDKMKRREFLNKSLGGVLLASGIKKSNFSISADKSIEKNPLKHQKLIFVKTSGSPGEIGYQYGEKLKDLLVEFCKNRTSSIYKRYKKNVIINGRKELLNVMEHKFPYIVEEMRGIAEGAEISFNDYSLSVLSAGFSVVAKEGDECTNIIFKESDDGPILGKTLDGSSPTSYGEPAIIRLIKSKNGNTVLCKSGIDGIVTASGLNDKGFAAGQSSIHFFTTNPRGVIRNLLIRPLLSECFNVEEGINFLAGNPTIKSGFNFSMVDMGGNAAIMERSPTECYPRRTDGKVIFCTNHTATPFMRKLERSRGVEGDKNSDDRFENLKKITSADDFKMSLESMKKILRNHNKPGEICQHGTNLYTRRAYINLVKEKKFLIAQGNPCKNDFVEFSIS